ncbi:hypothetical protein [Paenibacillus terrae]|uniref:hypothetical protein n=1 Tax=Paenibacillus terrae TaxID=159743 RepID=UPI000ACF9F68|nr:hypothetical protein [Paenibacillus terrae]
MRVRNLKKKLIVSFSSLVLLSGIYSTLSYATTFSGGRGGAAFSAYYDSSVQSYGYTGHYDDARANWNATSSRVNITRTYNTSNTSDKYYIGMDYLY